MSIPAIVDQATRRRALLLTCLAPLVACGDATLPALTPPEVDLQARVEDAKVGEGTPIHLEVRATVADGWTLVPSLPQAEGLDVQSQPPEGPIATDQRQTTLYRYTLTGDPGSYVIYPGVGKATGPGDETRDLQTSPIFVDIGVDGPTGGPMADLLASPPPEPTPWGLYAAIGGAGLLALAGAGALGWWATHRPKPEPVPDPPHVVAQRDWKAARDSDCDDHALALELSMVLRRYLEAITGFPATARTSREILRDLEQGSRLGSADRMRAGHVLDATDRLKFAREGGGEAFFAALDEDFDAVIEATRPRLPPPGAAGA